MGTGETVENPITDARERLLVHKVIIDRVDRILTPEMIAKVFESSYEEGHDDVQEVAAEIAGVFVALLKWGHEVRDVNVEESWHIIYSALLNFAIKPLHEILDFSRRCDAQVLDAAQSATTPPTLSFIPSLHLSLDENDIVSFSVAMQDVKSVLPPEPVVKRKGLFRRVAS